MRRVRVDARALRPGHLTPPLSKSDVQRALVLAHVAGPWPWAPLAEEPAEELASDVRVLSAGLAALRGDLARPLDVDCADGGAPFRLLLTQAALTPGATVHLTGTARLGERPHDALVDALLATLAPAGLSLAWGDGARRPWPLTVRAAGDTSRLPPHFRVPGDQSSQYASSLLLGCAALHLREGRAWSLHLEGALTSAGYLELTLAWMERWGFTIAREGARLTVTGWRAPPAPPQAPGDWSSLGYLLVAAWRTSSTVARVDPSTPHPDQAVVRVLRALGLAVDIAPDATARVHGTPTGGLRASGAECPDLLPTLAALACVLPAPSVLEDVGVLRLKESDRLEGIRSLVGAFGGTTLLEGERLTVQPPPAPPAAFAVDSRDDHRLAMSAALLAVLSGAPLTLTGPDCVAKSFPGFWRQLAGIGVTVGPAAAPL